VPSSQRCRGRGGGRERTIKGERDRLAGERGERSKAAARASRRRRERGNRIRRVKWILILDERCRHTPASRDDDRGLAPACESRLTRRDRDRPAAPPRWKESSEFRISLCDYSSPGDPNESERRGELASPIIAKFRRPMIIRYSRIVNDERAMCRSTRLVNFSDPVRRF